MRLIMVYHENGGNESFEVGGQGSQGGVLDPQDLERPALLAQLPGVFGFKYLCGNSRAIFTGGGQCAMCLAADCADSAVMVRTDR